MKILFALALIAVFLGVLWVPVWLVARKFHMGSCALAPRPLRFILPGQLIAVLVLAFLADAIGLRNPAGLLVAIVFGVSIAGAGILFLYRALGAFGR